jgi:hypothetical protein
MAALSMQAPDWYTLFQVSTSSEIANANRAKYATSGLDLGLAIDNNR